MQKIRSVLKIGASGAELCDRYGAVSGVGLEIMLGTGCLLEFELRGESSGESAILPDYSCADLNAASLYCAVDLHPANRDEPPLLIFTGVELVQEPAGHNVIRVPIRNTAVSGIVSALGGAASAELVCELGGFDADGAPVFAWQFPLSVRSRVYLGGGSETAVSDPAYYTAVQVDAIAAGLRTAIGAAGSSAAGVSIADEGGYFTGSDVETALQELGGKLDGLETLLEEI